MVTHVLRCGWALTLYLFWVPGTAYAWQNLDELTVPRPRTPNVDEVDTLNKGMQAMIEGDATLARQLLLPLAESGIVNAQVALAGLLSRYANKQAQRDSLKWSYFAARSGEWRSQIALSRAYREGTVIPQDLYQALTWLDRAAGENTSEVETELKSLQSDVVTAAKRAIGQGDYEQAEQLLIPVAQSGAMVAQETLAELYEQGFLGESHADKAHYWYEKAAEQGSKTAQYAAAMSLLHDATISPEGRDKVVKLLEHAATPGIADAQYRLGVLYLTGWGVEKDEKQGIFWYRLAAEQGNNMAQYALGVHYVVGDAVAADSYEAHRWFKRAAELGNPKAQHNLALTYLHGIGTPKAPDKAQQWFQKAAMNGIEKANAWIKNADSLTNTLASNSKPVNGPPPARGAANGNQNAAKRRTINGWDWFSHLPDTGYTLQVISSRYEESVDHFLDQYGLQPPYFHYFTTSSSGPWHVVQYGFYPTKSAAIKAANRISENHTHFKPWVRKVSSIKYHFAKE